MTLHQEQIIAEARRWIGTPYQHQSDALQAGTDCLGLIRGIWRGLHGAEPEVPPAYSQDWSEPQSDEALWRAAKRHLIAKQMDQAQPGDVLLFRMRSGSVAKHLGIQSAVGTSPRFIHAYSGHGVVESPLSKPWARRIVARFEFPQEVT